MTDTTVEQTADEPKPKIRLGPQYVKLWTASVISNLGDGIAFVAYPWLASAITRNPLLIALIAVAQRLPWLVFSLPAGVITDRVDRRRLIVLMDVIRTGLTTGGGLLRARRRERLPSPDEVAAGAVSSDAVLYTVLLVATLLLGLAEVLRDNAAQTILPAIVRPEGSRVRQRPDVGGGDGGQQLRRPADRQRAHRGDVRPALLRRRRHLRRRRRPGVHARRRLPRPP